jgi:phosphorylase/glycogen(starch) synthase
VKNKPAQPDYIFEVSWEVCNKVGGIHTVISSKALTLVKEWEDRLIMIGPDIWKGEGEHPEFVEDKNLFASWRSSAKAHGLEIKIGRWKITGNPIAILVDFTPFFATKDDIFSDLWIRYKVDSLKGGWDYIEPALFGYAAGKVIECFYDHHLTFSDKIIAQFHEWITGVGLLYLNEHVPQIGTVFTTHATVVGRSIAGSGLPLYSKFESYNADQEARNFNVTAKHSLEKMSAFNADCFTTVSELTARECERFLDKKPDIITPNGFDDFIVPDAFYYKEKRTLARKKLVQVAQALLGYALPEDTLMIIKSGRYEFRNKGIDLFIDALGVLNKSEDLKKNIAAFIFIPAHSTGPRKGLLKKLEDEDAEYKNEEKVLTHYVQGAESDLILNRIKQNQLDNSQEKKVKVIFVPVYMSGHDGIFNMNYYELLVGFDLSAFPSYYEPWGYTPLESLAFHVPTITTNLTGFGMIIHLKSIGLNQGISVIDRTDDNDKEAVDEIAAVIREYSKKSTDDVKSAREAAFQLSKTATWKNFIRFYKEAYEIALDKADSRAHKFIHETKVQVLKSVADIEFPKSTEPVWRKIYVQAQLPENLKSLEKLARNLWWTWNAEAVELFGMINPESWIEQHYNPILLLDVLPFDEIKKLGNNAEFISRLNSVNQKFEAYLKRPVNATPQIAYFCMEYGLCANLKLYSGGLGILAGDYLKQASDSNLNVIGIGLLYRNGYFRQKISIHGEQIVQEDLQKFTSLPMFPVYDAEDNWLKVGIGFPGRTLYAKIWKIEIGKTLLYLLDTDIPENKDEDRAITDRLYGGDWENRLKQELLIGIGGVRVLSLLGIKPDIYHYNEGHVAFSGLERILMLVQEENISFQEALEIVRSSTLFTTHTPVPAGHDTFSEALLRVYLSYHTNLLNISWKQLMSLGKADENDQDEKFSMSILAARFSQEMNGVSVINERVSRNLFGHLWKGYAAEELHIGHVTNGVHYQTWTSPQWQQLYSDTFGEEFLKNTSEPEPWKKIYSVPDKTLWGIHTKLKSALLNEIKRRVREEAVGQSKNTEQLLLQLNKLNENTLIIGFARRFATYKRSSLIFQNLEKLASVIRKSRFPVLFLFAGKAHPNDSEGQQLLKHIVEISQHKNFQGQVLFIQNYDMELAKYFTQGVDVWLNTPDIEMEASGTSGMKAALNGVLNFSALDGWWGEAYTAANGWTFSGYVSKENQGVQDEIDAEMLYEILENDIIPLYANRDKDGIPVKWIEKIKNAIYQIAPRFTTHRMLKDYVELYYNNLYQRSNTMKADQFKAAKELAGWKAKITKEWNNIQIVSMEVYDSANKAFPLGSELNPSITLDINSLSPDDIGVEAVFIYKRKDDANFSKIAFKAELISEETVDGLVTFSCKIPINQSGVYEYGFRIYPKNALLIHRMDFPLLKWI